MQEHNAWQCDMAVTDRRDKGVCTQPPSGAISAASLDRSVFRCNNYHGICI